MASTSCCSQPEPKQITPIRCTRALRAFPHPPLHMDQLPAKHKDPRQSVTSILWDMKAPKASAHYLWYSILTICFPVSIVPGMLHGHGDLGWGLAHGNNMQENSTPMTKTFFPRGSEISPFSGILHSIAQYINQLCTHHKINASSVSSSLLENFCEFGVSCLEKILSNVCLSQVLILC